MTGHKLKIKSKGTTVTKYKDYPEYLIGRLIT